MKYLNVQYLDRDGDMLTVYGYDVEDDKYTIRYNDSKHQFADYIMTEKELLEELVEQDLRNHYYKNKKYIVL